MRRSLIAMLIGRAGVIILSFVSIPILLRLLGPANYGVWVTLTSVLSWFLIFDFGIANALKNRIAEASILADPHRESAAMISGSVQIYALIAVLLFIAVALATIWVEPLKSFPAESLTLFSCAILVFPLSMSNSVLQANGRFQTSALLLLPLPLGWLLVCSATLWSGGGLTLGMAAAAYGCLYLLQSLATAKIALSAWIDTSSLMRLGNARHALGIVKIGLRFFALQISSLILFSAGNFYCYQRLAAQEVAQFDTVNKVFLLFSTVLSIMTTVLWTEASRAKARGDRQRLLDLQNYLLLFSAALAVCAGLVALNMQWIVRTLSHGQLDIQHQSIWPFALLVVIQSLAFSGSVFLNVFERIHGQLVLALIAIPLFLVLSDYCFRHGWGIASVPLATSIALLPSMGYCVVAARRIIVAST